VASEATGEKTGRAWRASSCHPVNSVLSGQSPETLFQPHGEGFRKHNSPRRKRRLCRLILASASGYCSF